MEGGNELKRKNLISKSLVWLLTATMAVSGPAASVGASVLEEDSGDSMILSQELEEMDGFLEEESEELMEEDESAGDEIQDEEDGIAPNSLEEEQEVLHLSFEGTMEDSSLTGNQVSAAGTETYTDGLKKGEQAFLFDGTTYLNLGTSPELNPSSLTVSFWVNPEETMSGEQIFFWNKEEYNTDGWYLASESDTAPLALSVGSADGQPYKVSVRTDRDTFFPAGEWTQVTVTFDEESKDVKIYRNGEEQETHIDYAIGQGGADGVIDSDNTMQKAIGYNGPKYNGSFLKKIAMDEVSISNYAKDAETIQADYDAQKPAAYEQQQIHLSFEGNLEDSSSGGHTVTANGTENYTEGAKEGTQAFQFDGTTYLDLGTSPELNPSSLTTAFWVKPETTMSGEQIFVWNKEEWYTDGWYISSENDNTPVAISIGSSDSGKQPYKVSVKSDRSKFFPAGEWTHVAVTFDEETKEVKIYRNGKEQETNVDYAIGNNGADGVIDPDNTMQKALGYNGPKYNGGYASVAMDEFLITDAPMTQEEIIGVYEECREFTTEDDLIADYEALSLPSTVAADMMLPEKGENGSAITWESSNEEIIATDGKVTVPEEGSVEVTLKATLSLNEETREKEFIVTVQKPILEEVDTQFVTVSDDYQVNALEKENEYLLSMSSEKFLYEFYIVAGLDPVTDSGYGGWEASTGSNFRGHFFGHYMSALSQSYVTTRDEATKEALMEQIVAAVEGLKKCQDAYGEAHPSGRGYISAFKENRLDAVEGTGPTDQGNVIVPYYNLHKVLAGLIDIARNVQGDVGEEALSVACNFGEYLYNRSQTWSDATKNTVLTIEYGGMNEALYNLFYMTGNEHFEAVAECFDETALFDQLAAGNDVLPNKHANTTIPKFIGALKRYQVMDARGEVTEKEEHYLQAAINFWDIVIEHHTYITGGNSESEHFRAGDTLGEHANNRNCETCNTYNMLKLSRALFQVTGDKKYMDYYENTYINAILSSQNPETGMTMYFQPMAPGYYKLYSTPYDSFWCCTGTGVENFTKLGDTIYLREEGRLYVNMFFSSNYDDGSISLSQEANMPNEDEVKFTVNQTDGSVIYVRQPDWLAAEATIKVNGAVKEISAENGYFPIEASAGDEIEITMPMEVTYVAMPDKPNMIAFKYGPTVLSTGLGTKDMDKQEGAGIIVYAPVLDRTAVTTINLKDETVEEWKANLKENLVRIEDSEDGQVQFKLQGTDQDDNLIYTPHYLRYNERYGLYMNFAEPDSAELQAQILENKVALREQESSSAYLDNFDNNNYEMAQNLQASSNSGVGTYGGRQYRHAEAGGWFSYQMKVDPDAEKNYLSVTYTKADNGRSFDIYLNGEKFVTERLNSSGQEVTSDGFYTIRREIPAKYLTEDQLTEDGRITIKFQSTGGLVGGLYGISINTDYDTNPNLKDLTFSAGEWDQPFDPEVKEYTITVPKDTESVKMKATPVKDSGLVYVGDILIDDTQLRTIVLGEESTDVVLNTKAQDHETAASYTIHIVKGEEEEVDTEQEEFQNTTTEVKASVYKESQVLVEWEPVKNAQSYGVYRKAEGEEEYQQIAVLGKDVLSYVDKETEPEKTYSYTVKGFWEADGQGISTKYPTDVQVTLPADTEQLQKDFQEVMPQVTAAVQEDGTVSVDWESIDNAKSYRIYRKTEGGSFKGIATTDADTTSYVDRTAQAGVTYYYTVKGYWEAEAQGVCTKYPTDIKVSLPLTEEEFATLMPSVSAAVNEDQSVTVNWKEITGAKSYRIYRKEAGGSFTGLANAEAGTTTYMDKTAKPGTTYYYTVKGFWEADAKGTATKYPSDVQVKIPADSLETPVVSTRSLNYCTVEVSWDKVSGADKYVIYRKEAKAGTSFKSIGTVSASVLSFRDGNAKMGVSYYYTVKAYAGSQYSDYQKNATGMAVPSSPSLSASGNSRGVTITWTGSKAGANTFADGYRVFRKTAGGSWKTIGTVGANTRSFTDTTGTKGTTYYYTVRAYVKQSNGTNLWGTYNATGVKGVKK